LHGTSSYILNKFGLKEYISYSAYIIG
jgi:hypothetical protein